MFPFPRLYNNPDLKVSPPSNQLVKSVSSGVLEKAHHTFLPFLIQNKDLIPHKLDAQDYKSITFSFSPYSLQVKLQLVPINRLKIFE